MLPSIKGRSSSVPNSEVSGLMLNGQTLRQKMIPLANSTIQLAVQPIAKEIREQHPKVRRKQRVTLEKGEKRILDGFALLEASGVALPDKALMINLSDKDYTGVAEDDLAFFTEMIRNNPPITKNQLMKTSANVEKKAKHKSAAIKGSRETTFCWIRLKFPINIMV